jgi:hypothetical protein
VQDGTAGLNRRSPVPSLAIALRFVMVDPKLSLFFDEDLGHALQGCGGLLFIKIDVRHAAVSQLSLKWTASPESRIAPVLR